MGRECEGLDKAKGGFLRLMPPREMIMDLWIDKSEIYEGLGIEKEIWDPAACKLQPKVRSQFS